jgi:hypothetical protein
MKTEIKAPDAHRVRVAAEYLPLHKYLAGRYADTLVLTFTDIEALLGFPLPDVARRLAEWWSNADAGDGSSPQCAAWIGAGRTAKPNVRASNVVFARP